EAAGSTGEIGKVPTPRADVLITVPVFALLGLTDEPAELDGYGPIPASMARKLVADGADSFHRVLVDPRNGAPLEIGRTRYRLTPAIKQWLRIRDRKCTFPGCSNHTPDNDTDHLTAWHHGGATDVSNLAQLCPKHHSHWTPDPATPDEPPGWTSPTGRHYQPEGPTPEPTHWPPGILPAGSAAPPACFHGEQVSPEDLPPWEPDDDTPIDPDHLPPDDPVWAEFYGKPFVLPV
ncbi:HNH endonuclease signature motif containing protein, partial [Pseudarthrobacter phenanthrenivorans]